MPKKWEKLVDALEADGVWLSTSPRTSQPLAQLLAWLQGKHTGSPGGHGKYWPGTTQPGLTTLSSHKCDHACLGLDNPGQAGAPQDVARANGGLMSCSTGERKPERQATSPDTGTVIRFPEPHHCSIMHTRKLRSKEWQGLFPGPTAEPG